MKLENTMQYQMQEGYLTLGEGDWQDRTVNMLAANHLPAKGANLVITREQLPPGVSFADYVQHQKAILAKELNSFALLNDTPDIINELPAHFLEFTWDNQGTAMHQMICVLHNNENVLNLTVTVPGAIDETSRSALLSAMKSFKPGPAPLKQKTPAI